MRAEESDERSTLLDVERLLDRTDPTFRLSVIAESKDELAIRFWRDLYPAMPKDAHLPIITRLGQFVRPQAVRNVLCNSSGTSGSLNFRAAMDEGRITLFNLSDGTLGEQNSRLLGQLVVSKFQLATMSRADQPKDERRAFRLYCDEFQTFTDTSASSYERMLSRARKYGVSMVISHQATSQIPTDLLKEIMGNVSTCVCFNVSREDAMKFSREFITSYNGEIINIPEEEILSLRVGEAWCKIGQHSFEMKTYLADSRPDHHRARYVTKRAYDNYRARSSHFFESPNNEAEDYEVKGNGLGEAYSPSSAEHTPSPQIPLPVTAPSAPRPAQPVREEKRAAASASLATTTVSTLDELDPADLWG